MGTTLTGTQINNTYDGLIKVTDNGPIGATTKLISDGLGNDTCIKVGTAGTDFLGNVDFSAATVTGLPGGAAGLVSGTGLDSMKNADSLVTTPASALGLESIALGNGACAKTAYDVAIGSGAVTSNGNSISIGHNATNGNSDCSIAIGFNSCVTGWSRLIAIGCAARHDGNGYGGAAIGQNSQAYGPGISIGCNARAGAYINAIAIGQNSCVTANSAVALGVSVTAATADTVTVCALETCVASTPTAGGILMKDASGVTSRRLNIDAAGTLQIDSTPVGGGGGAAGLVNGTGTDSLKNADSLVTTPAVAACPGSIALGNGATANPAFGTIGAIVIGCNASTTRGGVVVIGGGATASDANTIAIGYGSCVSSNNGVTIGYNAVSGANAVAVGTEARATQNGSIYIGCGLSFISGGLCSIIMGHQAGFGTGNCAVSIGRNATAKGANSIVIGNNARIDNNTANDGAIILGACHNNINSNLGAYIAVGCNTSVTAQCAIALGANVTASRACTATSCQYEACVAGKGIVVTSPDGLTTLGIGIDNSGNIVTYTP